MKRKKILIIILASVIALNTGYEKVYASLTTGSEVPYQTYTYDKWGNATPAPNGYLPEKSIRGTDMGIGDFYEPQDLFYCRERGEIYIADSGNKRIIVTDSSFNLLEVIEELTWEGKSYFLERPTGVYAAGDGTIYIADQGNKELIIAGSDRVITKKYGKPVSSLIDPNMDYKPNKVVVDDYGNIYIQASGVYQGLIYLKPDGTFVKYFGANKVEMTWRRVIQKLWKTILSEKASKNMQAFNPIEYGNIYYADEFIYASAAASESNSKLIVKLNPLGVDVIKFNNPVWYYNATFNDITVDETGNITVLDAKMGRIFQSDKNGQLMFAFGGIGSQLGLFKLPNSIIEVDNKLYVLDADKRDITVFGLTSFGKKVRAAISLYNSGLYQESIEPWEEVIKLNSNYLLAYTGVGKAYYQLGEFETAMHYYRLANDRVNYSVAFKEYSILFMRKNFGLILLALLALTAAFKTARVYMKKARKAGEKRA